MKRLKPIWQMIDEATRVGATNCWLWNGRKHSDGYGMYGHLRAHRRVYEYYYMTKVPKNLQVCHKCDVRLCINPSHLTAQTRSWNMLDASAKNRISRKGGARIPERIREVVRNFPGSWAQCAVATGISYTSVYEIKKAAKIAAAHRAFLAL